MTDREGLASEYAWVLGKYGEGSPRDADFLREHGGKDVAALLTDVVLVSREMSLKGGRPVGVVATTADLKSMAVDGVSDALSRWLVRSQLKPDQLATMRAFRTALLTDGPAVESFLSLWLGFIPGSYERGLGMTVPQDLKDEFEKIKADAEADGKTLLLEVEDFARHCVEHGKSAAVDLLNLLKARLGK